MARRLAVVALIAGIAGPCAVARAQSVRYPPDAPDADRDAEQRSALWESALAPERAPYEELVRSARRALDEQSEHGAQTAVDQLTDAIRHVPDDPRAYALRGQAYLALHDWARCADDLATAAAKPPGLAGAPNRDAQELALGICQGRAGRYADAEQTLQQLALRSPHGEAWLRLGEVRIALGKLDEAIAALDAALDSDGQNVLTHWLLAAAYDRSRRPSGAEAEAQIALGRDVTLSLLVNPIYPWIGRGEGDYLLGLAYSVTPAGAGIAMPEYSLLYFRHFLATAPDSPWRRRAQEHVRALVSAALPQAVSRDANSTSVVEITPLRPALERAMPALRACVAKQPTAAYAISIVKVGPKTDAGDPFRVHHALPQPGVKVELRLDVGEPTSAAAAEATRACLEPIAERIALPAPKDRDTWYRVSFLVIGP